MIDIRILGDKQLQRDLKKLEAKVQKKYMRQALRSAAKDVRADAKQDAAKDTGGLKRGIKIKARRRSRTSLGVRVLFKPEHYYGKFIEWGAPDRNMERRSFLYPAVDDNEAALINKIARELRAKIRGFN